MWTDISSLTRKTINPSGKGGNPQESTFSKEKKQIEGKCKEAGLQDFNPRLVLLAAVYEGDYED